jgi:hypothetical protein
MDGGLGVAFVIGIIVFLLHLLLYCWRLCRQLQGLKYKVAILANATEKLTFATKKSHGK